MPTPETELEFTRIWKGIRKKVDMRKVMKHRKKEERQAAFKKELAKLPLPAKNLKNMKSKNISKVLSIALFDRERFLKRKEKTIRKKKLLSAADQKTLTELENLKRIKKGLSKSRIKQARPVDRTIRREELVTQGLKKRGLKVKTAKAPKKPGRGRKPSKRKKQIFVFSKKRTVQGKTREFKTFGSVTTKKREFWVIEANLKTGKIRLRDKKTGRFARDGRKTPKSSNSHTKWSLKKPTKEKITSHTKWKA